MVCYGLHVPVGVKVTGFTADGRPTTVLPGEYVGHLMPHNVVISKPLVRLVGADSRCRDVHVPLEVAMQYLALSANDGVGLPIAAAA